jgi:uncharacterized DUF497 family protein
MRGTGIRVGRRKGQSQPRQTSRLVSDRCRNFAYEIMERIDEREDYGEIRFITLGRVDTEVYRVVFTWRGENLIHIISAQKASRDEKEIYHRATFP